MKPSKTATTQTPKTPDAQLINHVVHQFITKKSTFIDFKKLRQTQQ